MSAVMAERVMTARAYSDALSRALAPRKRMTVSEWADAHRILSTKSSAEPGPWRSSRVPDIVEPMDCLSVTSPVRKVILKKASQRSGTEIALNWIGYTIAHNPGPMLIVLPTLDVRKKWNRQRMAPLLSETPALQGIISGRMRDSAASAELRDYPGGFLVLSGANSPASLSSMPIRDVIADEVDRFPWEAGKEGDPLGLIRQRQATFRRRKELLISSPTIRGASRIDQEYEASDQRQYTVPCPHCDEGLVFEWRQMYWDKQLTRAWYVCQHCGAEIYERQKGIMLPQGIWVPQRLDAPADVRGYHLNGLAAPLGLGFTWIELAQQRVDAEGDRTKMIVFINTKLGEAWEDRSAEVRPLALMDRAEPYPLRHAPAQVLIATAGVDTQDDRLALQLLGWGPVARDDALVIGCWVLDWLEIPGHPADPALWTRLTDMLLKPIQRGGKNDGDLTVAATAIDTGGHFTHEVYRYIREARVRRLMAIKGANRPGRPVLSSRPTPVDVSISGRLIKNGVRLWTVGTDTAKHTLFSRLALDADLLPEQRMMHFSQDLEEDYYRQLTAERFNPRRNRWELYRGRRNEALDTWNYAYVAAHNPEIRIERMNAHDWERLRAHLGGQSNATPGAASKPAADRQRKPRRSAGGFGKDEWNL